MFESPQVVKLQRKESLKLSNFETSMLRKSDSTHFGSLNTLRQSLNTTSGLFPHLNTSLGASTEILHSQRNMLNKSGISSSNKSDTQSQMDKLLEGTYQEKKTWTRYRKILTNETKFDAKALKQKLQDKKKSGNIECKSEINSLQISPVIKQRDDTTTENRTHISVLNRSAKSAKQL